MRKSAITSFKRTSQGPDVQYISTVLYVSYDLRLMDGASRSIFLADFLRMKFAARTSCRSQLVRAEEFVFSRRLEKFERLAPSRESTLFLSHILGTHHTAVWQQSKK